jgi:hypothetical protein
MNIKEVRVRKWGPDYRQIRPERGEQSRESLMVEELRYRALIEEGVLSGRWHVQRVGEFREVFGSSRMIYEELTRPEGTDYRELRMLRREAQIASDLSRLG